ncbi:hypothetical protein AVEN_74060-1 [Araneus ventricosus]|uniref:Uncharacterized protein n=1 Tax=Araneus ventricosus TaxID=182803 RepID=A0A4Y2KT24_ARAVE|nr:hypothetical protein AVEN_74060-1 [Araneus ventricosus]
MFAALWLLAALVGCQHFCIISSDLVIGDPSDISQLESNFNPSKHFATLQQQVPGIPLSVLLYRFPLFGDLKLLFANPQRPRTTTTMPSDLAIGDASSMSELPRNFAKLFATFQKQMAELFLHRVPAFGRKKLPFVAPTRNRAPIVRTTSTTPKP